MGTRAVLEALNAQGLRDYTPPCDGRRGLRTRCGCSSTRTSPARRFICRKNPKPSCSARLCSVQPRQALTRTFLLRCAPCAARHQLSCPNPGHCRVSLRQVCDLSGTVRAAESAAGRRCGRHSRERQERGSELPRWKVFGNTACPGGQKDLGQARLAVLRAEGTAACLSGRTSTSSFPAPCPALHSATKSPASPRSLPIARCGSRLRAVCR